MDLGQQQQVSSLRFYLYDRQVHPELFDIYDDRRIVKSDYEAHVWVTGCTHAIGFYRDGLSLVEITADIDACLPTRGLLVEMPFRGERDHRCNMVDGITYMMSLQAETMSPKVYGKMHHDLARQGAERGLFVPFPMWMTHPPLTPFTFIDYEAKARQLHVFAFHAFPDDLTILKTQSIFELV